MAWPLLRNTGRAALRGDFATDAVASLAILTALVLREPLPGLVIVLMQTGGEALENMARGKASRALRELEASAPRIAHVRAGEHYTDVPVDEVRVGAEILVRPGEVVPVDGMVATGTSQIDTAQITGEPLPVSAGPGSELLSGCWNLTGPLHVTVTHTASQSQYARIVELVRAAQAAKAPIQRLADKYAVWFTPLTLLVAAAAWLVSGDPQRILAVLVVATPCPLIIATPVAILGGINKAAKRRIIVRSGAALEQLAATRAVVFDKTGTLTTGRPVASRVIAHDGWSDDALLRIVTALELGSGHLLARAIVAEAASRGIVAAIASDVRETAGRGVEGTVEGHAVAIGSRDFIKRLLNGNAPAELTGTQLTSFIAIDHKLAGSVQFDDELRADSAALIAALRADGVQRIAILSGDDVATVGDIASQLGVSEAHGDLKPEQKLQLLERIKHETGATLMVGDGTNDAPALAVASVGLAVAPRGGGIATETADIILLSDDLLRIREAFAISHRTLRITKQSIGFGLGLSLVGMVAAAIGWLAPVPGALYQEAIDVAVILNALRASAYSPHDFSPPPTD
jgi:heavy metal translocating P-type ATPase